MQWLRDGLGIIKQAAETGPLADKSDSTQSVYLVPAFVGLGAPYWNPRVRGALFGLTRNTGPAELAHAALESVCYQTFDLRSRDARRLAGREGRQLVLRVDGGMTASDWTMQRLADLLDAPVDRPMIQETTALGAAYLAGLQAGVYPEPAKFADNWRLERRFKPAMSEATRERKLAGWARAVKGVLASDEGEGMILPDGYSDVPAGKIAAVVTHLEMTERPAIAVRSRGRVDAAPGRSARARLVSRSLSPRRRGMAVDFPGADAGRRTRRDHSFAAGGSPCAGA